MRALRESREFSAQREEFFLDSAVWDRVWFGLDFVLARDPHVGILAALPGTWVVILGPAPGWGFERIRVFYTFTDEYVDLRWMEPG